MAQPPLLREGGECACPDRFPQFGQLCLMRGNGAVFDTNRNRVRNLPSGVDPDKVVSYGIRAEGSGRDKRAILTAARPIGERPRRLVPGSADLNCTDWLNRLGPE